MLVETAYDNLIQFAAFLSVQPETITTGAQHDSTVLLPYIDRYLEAVVVVDFTTDGQEEE